jgi:hypothetical protein
VIDILPRLKQTAHESPGMSRNSFGIFRRTEYGIVLAGKTVSIRYNAGWSLPKTPYLHAIHCDRKSLALLA